MSKRRNKKNKSNLIVLLVAIAIILLGGIGVYIFKNENINLENKSEKNTTQNNDENTNFNEEAEKEYLTDKIEDIRSSLGFIAIITSIDKYNAGGDYVTKKNKNLLEEPSDKQLFVMEQIVTNEENHKDFIILNMNGEVDKELTSPTMDTTTAYYPYNLFENEYKKYFNDTFKIESRKTSNLDNTYDKDENYIYYENRRSGLNGLSVTKITVNSITNQSSNQYEANITLHYSERLTSMLGVSSEEAELIYQKEGNNIKIDSYILK